MYNIPSGSIRWQISDFLSDDNSNVCSFLIFSCQNSHLKTFTLKSKDNVTEYNILNGPIWWQMSTSIKVRTMSQNTTF